MIANLMRSAARPRELSALLRLALRKGPKTRPSTALPDPLHMGDREFCYALLNRVSRSFALVIRQLPTELRDAVCLFYLVLRALDSIEDDMGVPEERKRALLENFHTSSREPGWHLVGIGDTEDYRLLLRHYEKVNRALAQLDGRYRQVIIDIARRMGAGMARFSTRPIDTMADYDQYCHYVAGLVGHGLAELFSASELESGSLREATSEANAMGLFLQKTNIIRDYHEDLCLSRRFWPREAWAPYAQNLDDFAQTPELPASLACLNSLVTDALRHVPQCLDFLGRLRNQQVFRFCALPQVMAAATLAEVYGNPDVFRKVVKIRKGLAARLSLDVVDLDAVKRELGAFCDAIEARIALDDPSAALLWDRLYAIESHGRGAALQHAGRRWQPANGEQEREALILPMGAHE